MVRSILPVPLLALAALTMTGGAALASQPRKPVRVVPAPMSPLPPALIDDTLAIEGDDIAARKAYTRMTVEVLVNGQGPYRFVVDSGADSTVVGTRVARALKLPLGTPATLNGMTASARVDRVLIDELSLGSGIVRNLEAPVLREIDLGGDGMLGIDALVGQRLMMDFEKKLIKVEDASLPPPRMDGEIIVTARRRRGQLILTEVKAAGLALEAVVDTGSEITIGNLALRDKLIRNNRKKFETVAVTGVTGVTVDLEMAIIRELKLGSVTLQNVPMAFADVPPFAVFRLDRQPALLLGTDVLDTFRRISLDFKSRKVRFQLRKCGPTGVTLRTATVGIVTRLSTGNNEAVCKR